MFGMYRHEVWSSRQLESQHRVVIAACVHLLWLVVMVAVFIAAGHGAHADLTSSVESPPTEEPAQQPCGDTLTT